MGAKRRLTAVTILVLVAMTLGMAACSRLSRPATKTPPYLEHTVRYQGETLSLIAKWYTGEAKNWSILSRENSSVSPNKLKIGTTIQIPRNLLTNTEPMPRSAIPQAASKSKQAHGSKGTVLRKGTPQVESSGAAEAAEIQEAPKPKPLEDRKEDLDLFGPKE